MPSRTSKRYLQRVNQIAYGSPAPAPELSPEAHAYLVNPGPRMSAAIFQELLAKKYLEPQGRRWCWTAPARAILPKGSPSEY